jgi:hypothetical protein
MAWLFGDWANFLGRRDQYSLETHSRNEEATQIRALAEPTQITSLREKLITRVERDGVSASRAARESGVTVSTAMAWLATNGMTTKLRPKVLVPKIRSQLVSMLLSGDGKIAISRKLEISVSTVTRILRTEPGLQDSWHAAVKNQAQFRARRSILDLQRERPTASPTQIRQAKPAAYAWLHRNEREWLEHTLRRSPAAQFKPSSAVDWEKRDRELALAVERVCAGILKNDTARRIPLWEIYQQLPELRPKLSVLDRLPLTASALKAARRASSDSGNPKRGTYAARAA